METWEDAWTKYLDLNKQAEWIVRKVTDTSDADIRRGLFQQLRAIDKQRYELVEAMYPTAEYPKSGDMIGAWEVEYTSLRERVVYLTKRPNNPVLLDDVERVPGEPGRWRIKN